MKNRYINPVQGFAFGGIANPMQVATLRGSDKRYLAERQGELDSFETQRQAYNNALSKFQTEVYNPYQEQVSAYNTAAQKYNTDVYNPYQSQYDAYVKAVEKYNAGPRTEDYAGPAAPAQVAAFDMAAPTTPKDFDMVAPAVPFKQEDVQAYQQEAAGRARQDAGNRAVAIDVASDPDKFNFGSMSVSGRFMAKGGEVFNTQQIANSVFAEIDKQNQAARQAELAKPQPTESYRKPPSVGPGNAYYESPEYKAYVKANTDGFGGMTGTMDMYESPYFGAVGSGSLGRQNDRAYESYVERVARDAKEAAPAPQPIPVTPPSMPVMGQPAPALPRAPVLPNYSPVAAMPGRAPVLPNYSPVAAMPGRAPYSPSVGPSPVRAPDNSSAGSFPASAPVMPSYTDRGVGAVGDIGDIRLQGPAMPMFGNDRLGQSGAAPRPSSYVSMFPEPSTDQAPGSAAFELGQMPFYGATGPRAAIDADPNLTPGMLGGQENAGYRMDRLGNRIYAPGAAPLYSFSKGGDVDLKALLAQNTETLSDDLPEEPPINTDPVGTAQKMLASLTQTKKSAASPTAKSIKKSAGKGGASAGKAMDLSYEPLSAARDLVPQLKETGSARSQMEALARAYKLRAQAATEQSKGFMRDTMNAPTLDKPNLGRATLAAKRFDKGGEAKKSSVVNDIGKWLAKNDINPSDFLTALGRVGTAAGAALTPSTLNEGEAEELAQEEIDAASKPAFVPPSMRKATKISRENDPTDRLLGAVEPAITLGTGAVSSLVGMPLGIYKGLTSGKFKEGKAADIAGKEAAAFIERNTYVPRSESGKDNLEALGRIVDPLKLAPAPGGAAIASLARPKAVQAQASNIAEDFQQYNRQLSVPGASYAVPPQSRAVTPAPASTLGFYSAAEQAALNLPRKEGTGAAFLNDLMKAPDVKKEELSAMGLDEFLKSKPKATRQEVQDFIANNRFDVKEVQLGGKVVEDPVGLAKRKEIFDKYEPEISALYKQMDSLPPDQSDAWRELYGKAAEIHRVRDREADAAYVIPELVPTKFSQYQLPGGENYRELLLTLPFKEPPMPKGYSVSSVQYEDGTYRYFAKTPTTRSQGFKTQEEAQAELAKTAASLKGFRQNLEAYKSSHFDEPNILAHMRVNDRVDADGKKMLLIEELQSDWHQAGRERGYAGENQKALLKNQTRLGEIDKILATAKYTPEEGLKLFDEQKKLAKEYGELESKRARGGDVPDAPFKDTWHQLALKRALKYAADNGYDRVGLTTGKQQAERYQLSKQISEVHYSGTNFKAYGLDGNAVITRTGVKPEDLPGLIGKEPAKKLLEQPKQGTLQSLVGQNLDVGGEGMKKYYDEIYPGFLAKQAKKYGAQVGETSIKTQTSAPAYVDYIVGRGNFTNTTVLGVRADGSTEIINQTPNSLRAAQQLANRYKKKHLGGEKEPIRYIDITPGMQDAVPYAKGGMVDKNTAFIKAHS